ncbi:hypothetical protein, partial [Methanoculleus sp.]|uniref:hypothetical protein n=1 Tax=Methanoculleus sp. TaxID=90427 RepID=UPI00272E8DC3
PEGFRTEVRAPKVRIGDRGGGRAPLPVSPSKNFVLLELLPSGQSLSPNGDMRPAEGREHEHRRTTFR